MKIAVVGTGYVGLVSGACFAEMGLDITCVDIDKKKIDGLNNGVIPIYEPGLEEVVRRNVEEGRLHFTTELTDCLDNVEVVFSAVGTPPDEDGSADLKYVLKVARTFGRNIKKYTVLVTKSTVPVGTAQKVKAVIREELARRKCKVPFDVASNPEFLKEGAAVKDFMSPDRVVVGVESERARKLMTKLYRPFLINNFRVLFMDIPSAEMTKYAANAMLATRISFMNEIANLCDLVGADVEMVRKGIGSDARIGSKFLYPGCGYGGSCFPKDVKALAHTAHEHGYTMQVIEAVERVNERQKSIVFDKLQLALGDLRGKTVAVWGLAFKPETDDIREAPALVVIDRLLEAGATVRAYDPVAANESRRRLGEERVYHAASMYEAAEGADAVALITEWKQFRMPDWTLLRSAMRDNIIVDGREANIIFIISKATGKIVWKLGPDYDNSPEAKAIGWIIGQHHCHMVPRGLPGEGNILIFDNGGWGGYDVPNPGSPTGVKAALRDHSRVLEIDPVAMKIVWQYTPTEAGFLAPMDCNRFYSPFISGMQRLPNGNTLITEGSDGRVFEVTKDHELVWEFISPYWGQKLPMNMVYRAYRVPYEWVPQLGKQEETPIERIDVNAFRMPGAAALGDRDSEIAIEGCAPYEGDNALCVASVDDPEDQ